MGKGKNKTFKLKEYKVPPEKYVVVVNPWGLPEIFDNNTKLNEIGAWFELLLRKHYPNTRVREIFYQKTHRNIIVELPREVDITQYLGAYHYSQFHKHISPEDTRTLYIYEYRYVTFGNPGNKDWTGTIPTNDNIPAGLLKVLKDPFPFPSPAPFPPADTPYARPIPQNIQNLLAAMRTVLSSASEDRLVGVSGPPSPPAPAPAPNVASSCSYTQPSPATESLFTPYELPSHYVAHVEASKARIDQEEIALDSLPQVKKMDPYEEEEVEKALLRSLSPIKKDESKEAVDFLNSFLSNVKSEEVFPSSSRDSRTTSTFDGDGDYKPSADLLDLFNTVDRKDVIVKSEVVETKITDDEDYRPSDELLAVFSDLSRVTECDRESIKQEPQGSTIGRFNLKAKEEPTETQLLGRISPISERKQLPRPSSSRTTMETPRQLATDNSRYNSNVQVKPEPEDDTKMLFSSNRHYPVPRDPRRPMLSPADGNSQSSRDPRKRPMHSAVHPIKDERNLEVELDQGYRKRVKMEH